MPELTREYILSLKPGPELNALVLTHIFNRTMSMVLRMPDYSTSMDAAMEVVEKMLHTPCADGDCYQFKLTGYPGAFLAVFEHHLYSDEELWNKYEHHEGRGEIAPEAICKAALLARLESKN